MSKLQILKHNSVQNAYKNKRELGLFIMFFTGRFFENVRIWASEALKQSEDRLDEVPIEELFGYFALEIATSVK